MGGLEWSVFGIGVPMLTLVLLWVHRSFGFGPADDPGAAPERKLQTSAVPIVGGPALFLTGLIYFACQRWFDLAPLGRGLDVMLLGPVAGALVGAFLVGLIDDFCKRGLSPGPKVLLQFAAALPLYPLEDGLHGVALVLAGVVAMNALNTFDNTDGAATALAAGASVLVAPAIGLGLLVFLPANLGRARFGAKPGAGRRPPATYLGDSGSHLLGMLLLLLPGAWMALFLPLLDLARVSAQRWRAGQPVWIGDRRHLAHQMEAVGWPPWLVVLALTSIAAPTFLVDSFGAVFGAPQGAVIAFGASLLFYVAAVVVTRGAAATEASPS